MKPILRDAALALPLGLAAGALLGGPALAGWCGLCTLLAVANLGLLRWLTARAAADAAGPGPGLAGALLSVKLVLTLGVVWALFQLVPPLAVVVSMALALAVGLGTLAVETAMVEVPS